MERKTPEKRILLVDDHPILRRGLVRLLGHEPDLEVCGEADTIQGALQALETTAPDAAVIDLSLKDGSGVDLIQKIRETRPQLPILVLSMHSESFYAERVLRAGANGYVTKGEPSEKVVEGIRRVLAGQVYVSSLLASKVLGRLTGGKVASVQDLTERELEVFRMIGQGMQSRQIAEKLELSVKTIEAHRENIKHKLGLADATALRRHAIEYVQCQGDQDGAGEQ